VQTRCRGSRPLPDSPAMRRSPLPLPSRRETRGETPGETLPSRNPVPVTLPAAAPAPWVPGHRCPARRGVPAGLLAPDTPFFSTLMGFAPLLSRSRRPRAQGDGGASPAALPGTWESLSASPRSSPFPHPSRYLRRDGPRGTAHSPASPGAEIWPNPALGKQPPPTRQGRRGARGEREPNVSPRRRPPPGKPRSWRHRGVPGLPAPPPEQPSGHRDPSADDGSPSPELPSGAALPSQIGALIRAPNPAFSRALAKLNLKVSGDGASAASRGSRERTDPPEGPRSCGTDPRALSRWRIARLRRHGAATRREPVPAPWARGSPPRPPESRSPAGAGAGAWQRCGARAGTPTQGGHGPGRATCGASPKHPRPRK